MAQTKVVLTSIHGKRVGLAQNKRLIVDGQTVPACVDEGALQRVQPAPAAFNTSGLLTAAQQIGGIVTSTTAAAVNAQSATGAQLDAALPGLQIDEAFDLTFINTGATNALTLTVNTNVTIVGNAVVALSSSGTFRFRKTAAATYVAYRI